MSLGFDNTKLITGGTDGQAKILDVKDGKSTVIFKRIGAISCIALTSDYQYAVAGSYDKSIIIYNLQKQSIKHEILDAHSGSSILSLILTPDNKTIISGSTDGSIKIFSIHDKEELYQFQNAHRGWVKCMTLCSNGRYLVTGSTDCSIKVIDLVTKQFVFSFMDAHSGPVNSLAISSDSKQIISGGDDNSIQILNFPIKISNETLTPRSRVLSPYLLRSNPANILKIDDQEAFVQALLNWQDLYYLPHN